VRPLFTLALVPAAFVAVGCARAPSALAPGFGGSIGMPHRGVLTASAELPRDGEGYRWLRQDDRHHGLPRFVRAIERAASTVARERPGGMLAVGDLSSRNGGQLLPHFSHRTGRDADLLLYLTTLDGAPVESPGFIHVGNDGLAWDDKGKRFLRFDVERTWLLVKTLVEDPEARIQWVFANRNVEALLIEWARARGESGETTARALDVMLEPHPGGPHDDHVHIRTACSPAEIVAGCEHTGPTRPWIEALDRDAHDTSSDWELLDAIARPFGSTRELDRTASVTLDGAGRPPNTPSSDAKPEAR
jgi:penicillin-insensitive murein DD-endopeptidase